MIWKTISYETRDGVAIVTFNRTDALNALTPDSPLDLARAFDQAVADDSVGCIMLTGVGRAFCAGADLGVFKEMLEDRVSSEWIRSLQSLMKRMTEIRKPLVAAINGLAVGGGATITLPCDIRVASDAARFSLAFAKIGLTPELGSTFLLPRIVGLSHASDLLLTGRMIDATEALSIGLISRVIPAADFAVQALAIARDLASGPTRALGWAKEALRHGVESDLDTALDREFDIIDACRKLEEHREGLSALLDKRDPSWE